MKKNFYVIKRILAAVVTATIVFSVVGGTAATVFAAQTVYEQKTTETLTRGVTYEENSRMTTDGIQNIYVLTVDLTESTLELKEVESKTEYGLKETTQKILTDNGAIAGVNSDFFGMSGNYSAGFGPVVRDGEVISAGTSVNHDKNQYGSYVLDKNGNSVFTYFKTTAKFTNGARTINLASINKVTSMTFPIYFDKQAASTTADLDKRFGDLVKFVVQNDTITYIAKSGETVNVPDDGYLIVMNNNYYTKDGWGYQVGDHVSMQVTSTIDFDKIDTAFGGGGLLLLEGQEAPATNIVAAGRQPRTAFGVSQDGKKAILMVVDGRGESIGATHAEMAALMRSYGAYEALHLDGGGSSTMVAKTKGDTMPQLKNVPSDKAQRKVIASVGVFQNAPLGEIEEIGIAVVDEHTQPGKTAEFNVYGIDTYQNKIALNPADVTLEVSGVEGSWNGFVFSPTTTGAYTVTATYTKNVAQQQTTPQTSEQSMENEEITQEDTQETVDNETEENTENQELTENSPTLPMETNTLTATANATCYPTARLGVSNNDIKIKAVGQSAKIYVTAYDAYGFGRAVTNDAIYTVANPAIGTMDGNTFTAKAKGSTYIKCSWAGQDAYVVVTVSDAPKVSAPSNTAMPDIMLASVTKQNDGAFYLNITGQFSYADPSKIDPAIYQAERNRVRAAADIGADATIYGGPCDVTTPTVQDSLTWNGSYRFMTRQGASVVMLAASKGIRATDPSQYGRMIMDLDAANDNNIIIVTDLTPSDYPSQAEASYFRAILSKYVAKGKNVFVVSGTGTAYWASIKDGIRYINLPDLWRPDGTPNSNVYMLKIRIDGSETTYQRVKI